jgi:hypothetical protein
LRRIFIFAILLLSLLIACKDGFNFNKGAKDPIIAKVGERYLFKSQIQDLVHSGTSPTDSLAIVDGYIQNWIRENLMIDEAEKNVAADINLNKLVDDYRSSLLVYNYEKRLIDTKLDTNVSIDERRAYYNLYSSQYLLSHPIFRCVIAKVPAKSPDVSNIKKALAKSDLTEALFLIKEKAVYHHIDTEIYMTTNDLRSILPPDMLASGKLSSGKIIQEKSKDYEYFVKILDYYDENKIPPFEYIEAKIVKTILSERKIQLLKKYRQDLYDNGISNKKFEIFKPE